MKPLPWLDVREFRATAPGVPCAGDNDPFGLFLIPHPKTGVTLRAIACGAFPETRGWEHVSVSLPNRCPNWIEMCHVKDLFWLPEECVVQFHPPRSVYRNLHPFCLHLWRHETYQFPLPEGDLVAPAGFQKVPQ